MEKLIDCNINLGTHLAFGTLWYTFIFKECTSKIARKFKNFLDYWYRCTDNI